MRYCSGERLVFGLTLIQYSDRTIPITDRATTIRDSVAIRDGDSAASQAMKKILTRSDFPLVLKISHHCEAHHRGEVEENLNPVKSDRIFRHLRKKARNCEVGRLIGQLLYGLVPSVTS